MRTTIHTVLLGAALCAGPLVHSSGCSSGDPTQVNGDAGPGGDGGVSGDSAGGSTVTDLAGSTNPEADPKLQGITALHNQARAAVVPQPPNALPPLTWDTTVAAAAQTWANKCMFQHSNNGYGENIFASTGNSAPSAIVKEWTDESANYTYSTNSCNGICGHYTQVVWRASLRLGCAEKTCTTGSPFSGGGSWLLVVCDYDPAGNFTGQKPY